MSQREGLETKNQGNGGACQKVLEKGAKQESSLIHVMLHCPIRKNFKKPWLLWLSALSVGL